MFVDLLLFKLRRHLSTLWSQYYVDDSRYLCKSLRLFSQVQILCDIFPSLKVNLRFIGIALYIKYHTFDNEKVDHELVAETVLDWDLQKFFLTWGDKISAEEIGQGQRLGVCQLGVREKLKT